MGKHTLPHKTTRNEPSISLEGAKTRHDRPETRTQQYEQHTAGEHGDPRWLWRKLLQLILFVGFVWLIGFVYFASTLDEIPEAVPTADGIIVLTGGSQRLSTALDLLNKKRGKRLLISGVNPATTEKEVANLVSGFEALFTCCVDLDRTAIDTIGNARQSAAWITKMKFRSAIIVTANYHMPRTMIEFRRALPNTQLIPYPVISQRILTRNWWTDPHSTRLLFNEYNKFLASALRLSFLEQNLFTSSRNFAPSLALLPLSFALK